MTRNVELWLSRALGVAGLAGVALLVAALGVGTAVATGVLAILVGIAWYAGGIWLIRRDRHARIDRRWRWLALGVVYAGTGYNAVVLNGAVGSMLLLGLPTDLMLSKTLKRIRKEGRADNWRERWRLRVAYVLCKDVLNRYDPGHC